MNTRDGVPVVADRAVVLVGCVLLVLVGTAWSALHGGERDTGPAVRPLACTMPQDVLP